MKLPVHIFIILIVILTNFKGYSSSDSLMHKIVLLERQIMLAEHDSLKASLIVEKSILYKADGYYSEALLTLKRFPMESLDSVYSQMKDYFHYEKAFNLFMLQSYSEALQEMWSMRSITSTEQELLFLMVLLESEQWNDFRLAYAAHIRDTTEKLAFYNSFQTPVFKDAERFIKLARVPGLGLIKTRYTKKGITSILLQTIIAGVGVYHYTLGYYFIGTFSGILPARRFYNGSRILTNSMVHKSNEEAITNLKKIGYSHINALYEQRLHKP